MLQFTVRVEHLRLSNFNKVRPRKFRRSIVWSSVSKETSALCFPYRNLRHRRILSKYSYSDIVYERTFCRIQHTRAADRKSGNGSAHTGKRRCLTLSFENQTAPSLHRPFAQWPSSQESEVASHFRFLYRPDYYHASILSECIIPTSEIG